MRTRKFVGALAVATAAIGGTVLLAMVPAHADTATPTTVPGNATTCSGGQFPAGLSGTILFEGGPDVSVPAGSADVADDNKSLSVTINAGWTASGIVVKGGNSYNLYTGPFVGTITLTGLVPPVNVGEQPPTISHWFVCGGETPDESSTPPATTPPGETTPPGGTTEPPVTTTTDPGLPVTGGSITGLVIAGVALVGGGTALLIARRRRAGAETPAA